VEYTGDSAASRMTADDVDVPWLQSARHLHVTGVFPALSEQTLAATHRAIDVMTTAARTSPSIPTAPRAVALA